MRVHDFGLASPTLPTKSELGLLDHVCSEISLSSTIPSMLVRSHRHAIFKRSLPWIGIRRIGAQSLREDDPQVNAMASNGQSYQDWSHESLVERVNLLEQQLKDQTQRYAEH